MFQQIQSIYTSTYEVLGRIMELAWKLLPFAVVILLLVYVWDALKNNRSNYTDFLFRVGVAGLALISYKWWSVQIASLIIEVAKLFKTDGISSYYSVVIELFKEHAAKEGLWFNVGLQLRGFLYYSLLWLSVALVVLATIFFEMIQFWAQAFLWVLGPLAIVFSLFPNFSGAFMNWLNRFIAVSFWSVIYMVATRIFNALISDTFSEIWVGNESGGGSITSQGFLVMKLVLFSLAFFFTIIRIPAMTGWFTRHSFQSISTIIGTGAALGANKVFAITRGLRTGAVKVVKAAVSRR